MDKVDKELPSSHQKYFNLWNQVSIDEIETNLYLGALSAATDSTTLKKLGITHILTLDTSPLPTRITDMKALTTKFIQVADLPKEDLLSHFDETNNFIEKALMRGAILVHCYFGVSRSATIVLAYLMRKHNLTYNKAFYKLKAKRPQVGPNYGFISQLNLYHEMGYKIDKTHMKYKLFRLGMAASRVRHVQILPQNFHDLIRPDPGLVQVQPEPNVYRCKKCRRVLASESNLLSHKNNGEVCKMTYFIEPLAWMNVTQVTQGKLHCPKCNAKVGSFCWIMGCQCPCGVQMAPAFYLVPSKIDFSDVVKNVEMTF